MKKKNKCCVFHLDTDSPLMDGACINLQAFYCQCCSLTGYATPVDKIMSEYNNIYLDQPRQQQGLFELQNY